MTMTLLIASALATTDGTFIVSRTIAIDGAISDRQCSAAAILAIIKNTAPGRRGVISVDRTVADR